MDFFFAWPLFAYERLIGRITTTMHVLLRVFYSRENICYLILFNFIQVNINITFVNVLQMFENFFRLQNFFRLSSPRFDFFRYIA